MRSPEDEFVKAITKHLDSLSFQPHMVGFSVLKLNDVMSERLAETMLYILNAWGGVYRNNTRDVPFNVAELGYYLMEGAHKWLQEGRHTGGILVQLDARRYLD